jgi:phosphoglycerate dehydrogenase-like enzyme
MTIDVLCLRPEIDFVRANALPPAGLNIAYRPHDAPDVPDLMKQVRALVIPAVGPKLSLHLFKATTVQFVQVTGAGLDRLELSLLKDLGISVANVRGGSNQAVAEYAVTVATVLHRRLAWADAEIRAGNYREFRTRMIEENLSGLEDLTAGIVGFGAIGVAVATAFHHRRCRILYSDPEPSDPHAGQALGATSVRPDELLKSSDIVSLHVPLLPTTQSLIGPAELASMKPGAVLIQASRGGIVDEAALAASLSVGHLGGAAIDVYSTEPPGPDNPLLQLSGDAARRVLFTPHIAGVTSQSATFLCRAAWRNVARVLINKEAPVDGAC